MLSDYLGKVEAEIEERDRLTDLARAEEIVVPSRFLSDPEIFADQENIT